MRRYERSVVSAYFTFLAHFCACLKVIGLNHSLSSVINYALRVMLQIVASLHHLRTSLMIVIYNHNMFIVQATELYEEKINKQLGCLKGHSYRSRHESSVVSAYFFYIFGTFLCLSESHSLNLSLSRVINYALSVMLQIVASLHHLQSSLILVIYTLNMFIVQATQSYELKTQNKSWLA